MWTAKEAEEFWKGIVKDRDKEITELKGEIQRLSTKAEKYEESLNEIANEGHSFVGEISKFCINTARRALEKEKLL